MNEETSALRKQQPESFYSALKKALARRKIDFDKLCPPGDTVARRALEDYGAMFVAAETVVVPSTCVFSNERETEEFQTKAGIEAADFDGVTIEL